MLEMTFAIFDFSFYLLEFPNECIGGNSDNVLSLLELLIHMRILMFFLYI